ncbi:hypothetical protein [Bythopirellula goksoeyrii]|uniref:Glycosyltransferase RgtA/B/C/D-like domain-containing protein n=1 Tax=Bythopirellula goksoeyrii TaxID=1400387 RepID=A0A5B9QAB5_9BACT|nr:hypothetical protein [Bythopirellula goksoeyrii]QEG34540.1 hypothetical protein Pr1d_18200 [Bythopirellula goksoeyrii]
MPNSSSQHWLPRLAHCVLHSRTAAVCAVGALSLMIGTLFVLVRFPQPGAHDEFSYLLAADTFLEGRLANPPHPFWQHFETIHVIQQPTYASKYQPGQGLLLALGTLLGGFPAAGAVIGTALATAAVCWMLGGWLPNRWALVGGLFVALNQSIVLNWTLSYWGGSLPLLGGALMFGAMPRLLRSPRARDAILLAGGAIVLAATRPYEGFLVGIVISIALAWQLFVEQRFPWRTTLQKIVLPATLVLAVGLAGLATYNNATTGSPFTLPYSVHEATYGYSPLFLWQSTPEEPAYRHEALREYQTGWGIQDYEQQRTLSGFFRAKVAGLRNLGSFYLGGPLAISLLAIPWTLKNRHLRFVWITLAVFLLAELAVPWMYPHYYAPIAPLLFLIVVEGLRYLRASMHQYPKMRCVVPILLVWQVALLGLLLGEYVGWQADGTRWERARVVAQLKATPEKDLVMVRYGSDHDPNAEWVYNRADIDAADIVWAREMSPQDDRRLVGFFGDRKVWLLEADAPEPAVVPYDDSNR